MNTPLPQQALMRVKRLRQRRRLLALQAARQQVQRCERQLREVRATQHGLRRWQEELLRGLAAGRLHGHEGALADESLRRLEPGLAAVRRQVSACSQRLIRALQIRQQASRDWTSACEATRLTQEALRRQDLQRALRAETAFDEELLETGCAAARAFGMNTP